MASDGEFADGVCQVCSPGMQPSPPLWSPLGADGQRVLFLFMCTGFAAKQLFSQGVCYTYDDCIFHPGHINFGAHEVRLQGCCCAEQNCNTTAPTGPDPPRVSALQVDLSTNITRNIRLRTPIVSSPMDTVTEGDMAVTMALLGGMGFVHYNNTIEEQVAHVKKAKNHKAGTVITPMVMSPTDTVSKIDAIKVCSVTRCTGAW